ncbi:epoxide hydrolase [Mycobacterium sp. 1100029.7]|nr:epoxide hydrolase [Mycobacterium sp. 1100029.7]
MTSGLSAAVDGFRLAFDRFGSPGAQSVVLLHGWPGHRHDYRLVAPDLARVADVVVPDLRGFGESDKHLADPQQFYSAAAQARSVVGLIDELGLDRVVLGGYDVGSRIAQALARQHPERIVGLVVSPPFPGVGDRVLGEGPQREFWYQAFHQLPVADALIDGKPDAVRAYLRHFWEHWSGPQLRVSDDEFERLAADYESPGAFSASIAWYRAGAGTVEHSLREEAPTPAERVTVPTRALWPKNDPLFPPDWAEGLDGYFTDVTVHFVDRAGHFTPLECAAEFAGLVRGFLGDARR